MQTVWDHPSAIPMLQKMWKEGTPCLAISRAISEKTRWTITRNAVIGKAHRLGLHLEFPRPSGVRARDNQAKACRKKSGPRPANQVPFVNGRRKGTDWIPDDGTEARRKEARLSGTALVARVESGAGVVSLNARPFAQSSGCRWVLAGGLVCCNPISRKVYCAGHDAVAYAKSPQYRTEEQIAFASAMLTRFDGVVDLGKVVVAPPKTGWDGARLAA